MCAHPGEGPRAGQVWKNKPDNWLKENKNQEELTYISDLTTSLLHYPHLFSLGVHLCLASILTTQTISLYALPLVVINL